MCYVPSYYISSLCVCSDTLRQGDQIRLLAYDDRSHILYFSSSLQNMVQPYSLKESRLLDPIQPHPSRLTCIALSPTGHLLLSTSALPPTLKIQNLIVHNSSMTLRSAASSASVILASFHPEKPTVFALGFLDGVVAVYDTGLLFRDNGLAGKRDGPAGTGCGAEVGFVNDAPACLFASGQANERMTGIRAKTGRLTAMEFLPGFSARLITAGLSGRCVVIDFSTILKGRGTILRRWYVGGPVTCMAIFPIPGDAHRNQQHFHEDQRVANSSRQARLSDDQANQTDLLIAIGRQDGKVLLQTSSGTMLGQKTFDHEHHPIVGLEWTNDSSGDSPFHGGKGKRRPVGHSRRSSVTTRSAFRSLSSTRPGMILKPAAKRPAPIFRQENPSAILASGRPPKEEVIDLVDEAYDDAVSIAQSFVTAAETLHADDEWQDIFEDSYSRYNDNGDNGDDPGVVLVREVTDRHSLRASKVNGSTAASLAGIKSSSSGSNIPSGRPAIGSPLIIPVSRRSRQRSQPQDKRPSKQKPGTSRLTKLAQPQQASRTLLSDSHEEHNHLGLSMAQSTQRRSHRTGDITNKGGIAFVIPPRTSSQRSTTTATTRTGTTSKSNTTTKTSKQARNAHVNSTTSSS